MSWNGNDNKDPWGRNDGPPDIDEAVKQLKAKVNSIFGGGSGKKGSGGFTKRNFFTGLAVILLAWSGLGIYQVEQAERAVILRLGVFDEIKGPGLHWNPPIIDKWTIVDVVRVKQHGHTALMLTKDENIIDIQFAVQYDIKDPRFLLFNVSEDPDQVVRQATESAVREVVGRNTMDFAITGGRAEIAQDTSQLLQIILDRYQTGVNVKAVEMQNAQPPSEVKGAFDDAVKAREDEVKFKNEAEAYANDIIPRARGKAARILQEAEAYRASVVAAAEGEASRFTQVLDEYHKAPGVTRDRLYIDAMEQVLSRSTKLMIDQSGGGNNVMYLPLDQLIRQRNDSAGRTDPTRFDNAGGIANSLAETGTSRSGRNSRTGRVSE